MRLKELSADQALMIAIIVVAALWIGFCYAEYYYGIWHDVKTLGVE